MGIKPTKLYALKKNVRHENEEELKKLSGPSISFKAKDSYAIEEEVLREVRKSHGEQNCEPDLSRSRESLARSSEPLQSCGECKRVHSCCKRCDRDHSGKHMKALKMLEERMNEEAKKYFDKTCRAQEKISLKIGAQVMLLWNLDLDLGLANGSRGVVITFVPAADTRSFIGNRKNTNVTGESELTDDQKLIVEHLERKCGDSSISENHNNDGKKCNELLNILNHWLDAGQKTLPVVRFANGTERVIFPNVHFKKHVYRCGWASRCQIPLMLAWAITIHKSQGLSIDRLQVDLRNVANAGQAYVSLSRARSFKQVAVNPKLNRNNIEALFFCDELVKTFYRDRDCLQIAHWSKFRQFGSGDRGKPSVNSERIPWLLSQGDVSGDDGKA